MNHHNLRFLELLLIVNSLLSHISVSFIGDCTETWFIDEVWKDIWWSYILSCFEYCSPVWFSAADSHLKLFDRNLNTCKFLIPDLNTDLWHRRSISCLCMLFKIYHNPAHPLHSELLSLFHPVLETRNAVHSQSHSLSVVRSSTEEHEKHYKELLIKGLPPHERITLILIKLHWLPTKPRIIFYSL